MKQAVVLIAILWCLSLRAQDSIPSVPARYAPSALQADFELLHEILIEYHPEPYAFISPEALEQSKLELLKDLSDSLTSAEFSIVVRKHLALIKCGHTVARPSNQWYKLVQSKESLLPFDVYWVEDKLYVRYIYTDTDKLKEFDQIIEINGRSSSEILDDMQAIKERDANAMNFVHYYIQKLFRTYYAFLYANQTSNQITVKRGQSEIKVELPSVMPTNSPSDTLYLQRALKHENLDTLSKTDWAIFYRDSLNMKCYLDINKFGNKDYKKFYKEVFTYMSEENVGSLIVDLRDNGGGYFPNGNELLSYFANEPFPFVFYRPEGKPKKHKELEMNFVSKMTKVAFGLMPNRSEIEGMREHYLKYKPSKHAYKGELKVLINGGSFSTSGLVSTFLKYHSNATFYGTETGGAERGSNGIISNVLTLPNSQVVVHIPYYHLNHQLEVETDHGVVPHVLMPLTLDELKSNKDLVLERALSE